MLRGINSKEAVITASFFMMALIKDISSMRLAFEFPPKKQ